MTFSGVLQVVVGIFHDLQCDVVTASSKAYVKQTKLSLFRNVSIHGGILNFEKSSSDTCQLQSREDLPMRLNHKKRAFDLLFFESKRVVVIRSLLLMKGR